MAYDLLITGGQVIDGTGDPRRPADVAISGSRIAAVGDLAACQASRLVDASGLIVCPGFIDIHAHGEEQLLSTPGAESKLMQGITTMVGGNCGISAAPITGPLVHFTSGVFPGLQVNWSTFEEFFARLETRGMAINLACLVGNATVRACVLGMEARPPGQTEAKEMKRLVAQSMQQGAIGLSSGLVYAPGSFSTTDEIVNLASVAAEYGGFYASHVRGMALPIFEAVREAIEIGKTAGLPVQVSHLNPGYPTWGRIADLIELLESARAHGMDVTADTLVYDQSVFSGGSLLPNWANEGGMPKLLKRLGEPQTRQRIKDDTRRYGDEMGGSVASCLLQAGKWDQLWLIKPERLRMKSLADLAEAAGNADPYDTLLDLILAEQGEVSGISQPYSQEDVDGTVRHPLCMPETDDRPVARHGSVAPWHRRGYGSFARLMGWYVRERGILPLEEAIRKSTSLPARRIGLSKRGILKEGFYADLTLFDPYAIQDVSTDEDPARYPQGIRYVIVNGQVVVEHGEPSGRFPGKVLRHLPGNQEFEV
jgi:N-acyl-D-amino-acid deacylase